ncbi:type 1 glutamine amidotransferase domain-containing protein [Pedobacter cryoconitis]|uniref:type 1 glutamine amidotransferase domain-containing protein n=1 Tax=Pedobacter cryoconitis TaxID=188932 RepID=UPI0016140FE9|nr:type 1 glutamine amidotransferase domain-containing protein [Pedobacter cryoconitis]MBB5646098.1 putative intracellular protease/amidase [Pedobacter cryoconitis]
MKLIAKYIFALFLFILQVKGYAQHNESLKGKKILFVVTSNEEVKNSGDKTGIWIEEFATPYYLLKESGVEITVVSPKGGQSPIDPRSTLPDYTTKDVKRFLDDPNAQNVLHHTLTLSKVNAKNYDAVFYPGGHGPMWDLPDNKYSISLIESFYNSGKPVSFVCHGPVALKNVKTKAGIPLIKDKKVTGYANTEEEAGQTKKYIPFLLEDMLKEKGANYLKADDWNPFVVTDGTLITGQNPASAIKVAEALITALSIHKD